MANVFLSHSSKDKDFVRWLAHQLKELGNQVWLDEWEIRVGDCIVTEIEKGIRDCDYVVIVLSPNAVSSTWVDREWKAKYWDEIQSCQTLVLPVLAEKCDIPTLLKTRNFADFTSDNKAIALARLVIAMTPEVDGTVLQNKTAPPVAAADINALLSRVGSRTEPLAQIIPDALTLAHKFKNSELEVFCKGELTGWLKYTSRKINREIAHRLIEAYASAVPVNPSYIGWNGNLENALIMFKNNPSEFKPFKFFMKYSVAQLESFALNPVEKSILHVTMPLSDFNEDYKGEGEVYMYMRGNTYETIIDSIRYRLTSLLIDLLPSL
jgi:hypothetical protein